ncbi:MAG TPA: DUF2797 domain-containing protein [Tenuifilaceae bacterium]|nr:DUF2797 domain-containing protein [Tenuifilaceae bacterium]
MNSKGILNKMTFVNKGSEFNIIPSYELEMGSTKLDLADIIDKSINLRFLNRITCISCGRDTKKSYGQGYCYPCFISVPQTEECVFRPELCRAHEGEARDMKYAEQNCLVDQYVYLALSGGLKVGVTRYHQVPIRWVDQGAVRAIKVAIAQNRYLAGLIEVELKKIYADKTNWRKMLMGNDPRKDLTEKKRMAIEYIERQGLSFRIADDNEYSIQYPVKSFPSKITSLNLDTDPEISGEIVGIKGQYLIFAEGRVLNIRKFSGYHVEIDT